MVHALEELGECLATQAPELLRANRGGRAGDRLVDGPELPEGAKSPQWRGYRSNTALRSSKVSSIARLQAR